MIKKIQFGFNPNSSSIGTMLWTLPWFLVFLVPAVFTVFIVIVGRFFLKDEKGKNEEEEAEGDKQEEKQDDQQDD